MIMEFVQIHIHHWMVRLDSSMMDASFINIHLNIWIEIKIIDDLVTLGLCNVLSRIFEARSRNEAEVYFRINSKTKLIEILGKSTTLSAK